ncbi:type II toxin-antitoxin system RelE/ParE family toxin [Nonomuraea angiospora]|uniref:type II toxin-antitoxin system RelE/ParE family toxin n=1 Tax=Nonomuraea angiospora TaxID=46172 RepID=UPI003322253E
MNPGHFYVDLLAAEGPSLGEPYTRQLDGVLRELRFYLDDLTLWISYWIASDRRIILLTVFHKTRMKEDREVDWARRALSRCKGEAHSVDEEW